jgi:hypothetical protein
VASNAPGGFQQSKLARSNLNISSTLSGARQTMLPLGIQQALLLSPVALVVLSALPLRSAS